MRLKDQEYKCAICGKTPKENKKRLAVDHNHNTEANRGLLCSNCNAGLGFLQDKKELLESAIKYLRKWED